MVSISKSFLVAFFQKSNCFLTRHGIYARVTLTATRASLVDLIRQVPSTFS
jgi:hypothetical protein